MNLLDQQVEKSRLLIVDDEQGPRESLRIIFKDDYDVYLAGSGPEAIELVRQQPVDVAVLDIRMVGMSGIELLSRLKQLDRSIEVVMLTAYQSFESAQEALRFGACDYLTKPFDYKAVRETVSRALTRHRLAVEIRDSVAELTQLREDIRQQKIQEEMAKTKGQIYASIIHDLNSPLTIISGYIELISQQLDALPRLEGHHFELVKERLVRIRQQVNNCIEISRRYLHFLRKPSEERPVVRINQVLSDLGELVKNHPNVQNNQLVIRLLSDEVGATMNGTDLIQVLLNLITNALQCSPLPHRVEIFGKYLREPVDISTVAEGAGTLWVSAPGFSNRAPMIVLTVQDDGPGIEPEWLPQIFEPFFTTKPQGVGTGLGLAIVERLVHEATGAIAVQSHLGKGTSFSVYLPAD